MKHWYFNMIHSRPSLMAARGPNPACRPYLLGPLSTLIYTETHRTMVNIWPSDIYLWIIFGPLWPTRKNNWEPLIYSYTLFFSAFKAIHEGTDPVYFRGQSEHDKNKWINKLGLAAIMVNENNSSRSLRQSRVFKDGLIKGAEGKDIDASKPMPSKLIVFPFEETSKFNCRLISGLHGVWLKGLSSKLDCRLISGLHGVWLKGLSMFQTIMQ